MADPYDGQRRVPSGEDPLARALSTWLGGPLGRYASPWRAVTSPLTVLLLVTTATFAVGLLQKAPCIADGYTDRGPTFARLCYSDVVFLFRERGFADGFVAYLDSGSYPALEYPVLSGLWMQLTAWTARLFGGSGDPTSLFSPDLMFFALNVLGLFVAALVTVVLLARFRPDRPYDGLYVAAAPSLALASTINWDLLAVALTTGAMVCWSRSRPGWAGVLIGLGAAAKFYPLLVLGPLFVVCWRAWADRRRFAYGSDQLMASVPESDSRSTGEARPDFHTWWTTFLAAAGTWTAVNLPVLLLARDSWLEFYTFNRDRGAELGSIWLALGLDSPELGWAQPLVNTGSLVLFALVCVGIAVLGLRSARPASAAELTLLTVGAFCVLNKVYSPQYVLWLLPLVAMCAPRWRDWAIWQGAEAFYWCAVWLHLAELTTPADGGSDQFYALAIFLRISATIYLMSRVVHDILAPRGGERPWTRRELPPRFDSMQEVAR